MQFSENQRKLALQAVDEAEEFTSRYYCIPPFRRQQLQYDLVTRGDHGWEPLPDPILASLQCFQGFSRISKKARDFYRIQLNDPTILTAAEREHLGSDIYAFLIYILTHEMVHLVRISSLWDVPHPATHTPEFEELRVHQIANKILSSTRYPNLKPVLDKFSHIPSIR